MSFNGTSVGLDLHALSVVAHAVDEKRVELSERDCARIMAKTSTG